MKVLLIAHACQVRHEGQQRAQQLGLLPGIDLHVVAPNRWFEYGRWRETQPPIDPSYRFRAEPVRFPWSGPAQWYFHHYPRLGEILRELQPDVIDLWEEAWGLASAHACWLRGRVAPRAKIVSETEANIPRTHPFPFKQFRSYVLRRTDYAIARQSEGVRVLQAKGYEGPVDVIGNAVDAEKFRPADRARAKEALGLQGFTAGYIGRLIEAKGLMDLVEALPALPDDVNLLFVGAGDFQGALESRVAELNLGSRVRFVAPQPLDALPAVMNALDALLLVSRTTSTWKEQFGRVIIEAHACEVPVIGSDSGAIPEVIGEGGLIVREGDSADIARAVRTLRDDPQSARAMGQKGRAQVEKLYTWKRVAELTRDVYDKVLSR